MNVRLSAHRLAQDRAQLRRLHAAGVAEVDLVVPTGQREPPRRHLDVVQLGQQRALVVVGADVQPLQAAPLGEGLEPQSLAPLRPTSLPVSVVSPRRKVAPSYSSGT